MTTVKTKKVASYRHQLILHVPMRKRLQKEQALTGLNMSELVRLALLSYFEAKDKGMEHSDFLSEALRFYFEHRDSCLVKTSSG